MSSRRLDEIVRRAISAKSEPTSADLVSQLAPIPTSDLLLAWAHFVGSRAFSVANAAVPDWKGKEQRNRFESEFTRYAFFPSRKDEAGKNVIVRSELEDHITKCLLDHIRCERGAMEEYRLSPWFVRLRRQFVVIVVWAFWIGFLAYALLAFGDGLFRSKTFRNLFPTFAGSLLLSSHGNQRALIQQICISGASAALHQSIQ